MPFESGVEFQNSNGRTIISTTERRYLFSHKISGTTPTGNGVLAIDATRVGLQHFTADRPIIFYTPGPSSGSALAPVRLLYEGGEWKTTVVGFVSGTPYEIYVFTEAAVDEDVPDWGVEVFNSAGERTFASGDNALVISHLELINRSGDTFDDNRGDSIPNAEWILGGYQFDLPQTLSGKKVAVNLPPYFYGFGGGSAAEFGADYGALLGSVYKSGDTILTSDAYWGSFYDTSGGRELAAPIWSSQYCAVIDCSLYD